VVVPLIFEQRLWGNLLRRRGAALSPLSFWKATPHTLAAHVAQTLASDAIRSRTRVLATAMAAEDGAGEATRQLELTFLASRNRLPRQEN
jgi:UDP:flavonoid glycosyltransferase YjiC (YdhE family)